MKSPRIGIKHSEQGSRPMHARNIKPIHLSVVDEALMVNNRAWIPEVLVPDTMRALHTKSHKCSSRMMRKAMQSVYFIGMRERLDEFMRGCANCVDSRPMKPALSRVPTEKANYPFEVITMDFAEFTKSGESFVVMSGKYSGALHVGGGTGDETINNVVNFARSNVGNINKIDSDRGTQFTGTAFQRWVQKNNILHQTSTAYRPDNNQAAESAVKRAKIFCCKKSKKSCRSSHGGTPTSENQ